MKLMRAAEILIEKIEREYKDDVAVVVIMGSTIYGETHEKSDLDMYFVVNTPRGNELGMAFIIDGIGFDFWPISWERLTRMANHDERVTSIITEGQIIYYGSDADLKKFNALKEMALDVSDSKKFIDKSKKVFDQVYKHYFHLDQAVSLSEARMSGLNVIYPLTNALALLNRDTVKRGRGKLKGELLQMPLVPNDFERLYDVIFATNSVEEIKASIHQLILNTEDLIESETIKYRPINDFKDQLHGFYEELINYYNKIRRGCEIGDYVTAFYAANEIVGEIEDVMQYTSISATNLPDIIGAYTLSDIQGFLDTVDQHQQAFVSLLEENGVELLVFEDMNAFERYMLGGNHEQQ